MLSDIRKISRFLPTEPSTVILVCLAVILALVFMRGLGSAGLVARMLPVVAFGLCLLLLLVPQRNISLLLVTGTTLSIPFAHFAVFVALGEGVQWGHLLGAVLIVHLIVRVLLGNRIPIAPATPWALGLVAATFISLFAIFSEPAVHITEFWKSEVQLLFAVLMFMAIANLRLEKRHLLMLLKLMILLSVGVAIFGIYQLPARYLGLPGGVLRLTNPSLSGVIQSTNQLYNLMRSSSIFSEPSYYGHYLVGMMALSLTAALHYPRIFGKAWVIWLIILVQAAGLVLSQSMGSFYMLAQLLLVMLIVERGASRLKLIGAITVIAGIGLGMMLALQHFTGFTLLQQLLDRVNGIYHFILGDQTYMIEGESAFMRVDTAKIALRVWLDHPFIGVGLGSYTLISEQYGEWNPFGFAANTLVATLAETGILGFLALLGVSVSSLYGLYRVFRRVGQKTDLLNIAARMVFYLVLLETLYFHVINSYYWLSTWFYLGLAGLIAIMAHRETREAPSRLK
jgi:O-antigen ligase